MHGLKSENSNKNLETAKQQNHHATNFGQYKRVKFDCNG
jgi:hypothetical protein